MTPKTPDYFPGVREDEGLILLDDGYGVPQAKGGLRYSDGYFYAQDEYGVFNVRTNVHPHINTHLGSGIDTFYEISNRSPTVNDDSYDVGYRWIDLIDSYEYVLSDNTTGNAQWWLTTRSGGIPLPHATTHIHNGLDQIDGDKLNIDFNPIYYSPDISAPEVTSTKELTAHLAGIDGYFHDLDGYYLDESEHEVLDTLVHNIAENSYEEFTRDSGKVVNAIIYTNSSKAKKIREEQITYNGNLVTQAVSIQYDQNGDELYRITETLTYSGQNVTNITKVKS